MADSTVLVAVAERPEDGGAAAAQLARIAEAIRGRGLQVRWVVSVADAEAVLRTEAGLAAAVVAWDLPPGPGADGEPGGASVLRGIGRRFQNLPVFLVMADEGLRDLPLWVPQSVVGYVWPLEDTPARPVPRPAPLGRGATPCRQRTGPGAALARIPLMRRAQNRPDQVPLGPTETARHQHPPGSPR
ncbi:Orn/Lys/Arg decarboxylase N-terminal domain-containing protein [Streptomyces caelestis]|uniref:Orn/Lys/Arg decarboxylase N-terminal domain-containing protein n=1 Tax=Streptomyces caelestis TaxID=36816 RepID=UPI0037020FD6